MCVLRQNGKSVVRLFDSRFGSILSLSFFLFGFRFVSFRVFGLARALVNYNDSLVHHSVSILVCIRKMIPTNFQSLSLSLHNTHILILIKCFFLSMSISQWWLDQFNTLCVCMFACKVISVFKRQSGGSLNHPKRKRKRKSYSIHYYWQTDLIWFRFFFPVIILLAYIIIIIISKQKLD